MKKTYRKSHRIRRRKPLVRNGFLGVVILFLFIVGAFSYFFFFSSENAFVNLAKIEKEILEEFPDVSQVKIKKKFPDIFEIEIQRREPIIIFCQDKNYLVDKKGIAFDLAGPAEMDSFLKLENLSFGKAVEIGDKVVPKEELSQILDIESKSESFLEIKRFIITPDKLIAKPLENWEIYLDLGKDIDWQMTKLKLILEEKIPLEQRGNLEYIELRFGNFASYKHRD